MNKKIIFIGIVSGIAGFAIGWLLKEHLDDKRFKEIQEELMEDADDDSKEDEESEEKESNVTESVMNDAIRRYKGVKINPTDGTEPNHVQPKKVVINEDDAVKESNKPVIIPVEEYEDEMNHIGDTWDKVEYTYYPSADLLVDSIAQVKVMDYSYDIGTEALDILRNLDEGSSGQVLYVRNPYLGCDIMITVDWDEPNAEMYDVPDLDYDGGVKG